MLHHGKVKWAGGLAVVAIVLGLLQSVSSIVEVLDQQHATLECPLPGMYVYPEWRFVETDTVVAYRNGTILDGYQWRDSKELIVKRARSNQSGEYVCKLDSGEATIQLQVTEAEISFPEAVVAEDEMGRIIRQINAKNDQNITVTCVVSKLYSVPTELMISINNESFGVPLYTKLQVLRDHVKMTRKYSIKPKESYDYQNIKCTAIFPFGSLSDSVLLRYYVTPKIKIYSTESPTRRQNITCTTTSRPGTVLDWYIDGQPLDNETTLSTHETSSCTVTDAKLYECKSDLTLDGLQKEDNNRTVMCDVIYQEESVGNKTHTLAVMFSPTTVNVTVPSVLNLFSDVTEMFVTCTTDSALGSGRNKSGVSFKWFEKLKYLDEVNKINHNYKLKKDLPGLLGGFEAQETISMNVSRKYDGAVIMCRAWNSENVSEVIQGYSVPLQLNYRPDIFYPKRKLAFYAYCYSTFQLPCITDSKHETSIKWQIQKDDIWYDYYRVARDDRPDRLMLNMVNLSTTDSGYYRCLASNVFGDNDQVILLTIEDRPVQSFSFLVNKTSPTSFEVKLNTVKPPTVDIVVNRLTYYVQYRYKEESTWRELAKPYPNTIHHEDPVVYTILVTDVHSDRDVEVRIKSLDEFERVVFSDVEFITSEKETDLTTTEESYTKTQAEFKNAILISVFATAALFIVIIIIVVCVMKNGSSTNTG